MSHELNNELSTSSHPAHRAIEAREPIRIRTAEVNAADIKFIDDLQKKHAKMVSFWPRMQLENYVRKGQVLIAESAPSAAPGVIPAQTGIQGSQGTPSDHAWTPACAGVTVRNPAQGASRHADGSAARPLGYIIGTDRYFKREDVGIIYQVNVQAGKHRSLIGAALVQAVFDRAAWGCKLFCCWCAQDLEANYFWESLGFVPLAFRAGSEKKSRVHIFWQKRIRENDVETPWWFPSLTTGGAIREGRLVLPIPPGTHWSDAKPMVIPGVPVLDEPTAAADAAALPAADSREAKKAAREARRAARAKAKQVIGEQQKLSDTGGLWFGGAAKEGPKKEVMGEVKQQNAARPQRVYHPKYIEAARELCSRFLDEVNREGSEYRLLADGTGKYNIARARLEGSSATGTGTARMIGPEDHRLLDAA